MFIDLVRLGILAAKPGPKQLSTQRDKVTYAAPRAHDQEPRRDCVGASVLVFYQNSYLISTSITFIGVLPMLTAS